MNRKRDGFGLLEILVALGILVVAFVPVAGMTEQGSRTARWTELQNRAVLRAAELLDREAVRSFADLEKDCRASIAHTGESTGTPELTETLEREEAEEGLLVLRATVEFELGGAGKRPRHTVVLERVVARPDASAVVPSAEPAIS